jgi:hypothetical protein
VAAADGRAVESWLQAANVLRFAGEHRAADLVLTHMKMVAGGESLVVR